MAEKLRSEKTYTKQFSIYDWLRLCTLDRQIPDRTFILRCMIENKMIQNFNKIISITLIIVPTLLQITIIFLIGTSWFFVGPSLYLGPVCTWAQFIFLYTWGWAQFVLGPSWLASIKTLHISWLIPSFYACIDAYPGYQTQHCHVSKICII